MHQFKTGGYCANCLKAKDECDCLRQQLISELKASITQNPCYEKLPPDFGPLANLLPVAKRELKGISKRYNYEPVVLTRFVQKLEEYLAAISS